MKLEVPSPPKEKSSLREARSLRVQCHLSAGLCLAVPACYILCRRAFLLAMATRGKKLSVALLAAPGIICSGVDAIGVNTETIQR